MYRAFHAIPATLTNASGMPTNAVYGFTQTLRKIIKEFAPEYIGVAFDMKGPTFRHEIFEEYKADRPAMPDILGEQIPYIKRMLRAMSIPVMEKPSYEADDIIATVVKKAEGAGLKSYMITGDKDMYQLVGENTVIFDYNNGKEFRAEDVAEKFGVPPGSIRDLLALAGDPSDGIPGVPGVGLKTAAKLLGEYGSIDKVFENIDKVKGAKLKERLKDNRDKALLSRELATLQSDVELDGALEDLKYREPDYDELKKLLMELGFQKLLSEIMGGGEVDTGDEDRTEFETLRTVTDLKGLIASIKEGGRASICLALTGEGVSAELAGVSVCTGPGKVFYVEAARAGQGGLLDPSGIPASEIEAALKDLLEDAGVVKDTDNSKGVWLYALKHGIRPAGFGMDTALAAYLLDPSSPDYNTGRLAYEYLGVVPAEVSRKGGKVVSGGQDAADIALYVSRLASMLKTRLEENDLLRLYTEMELPLAGVLAAMEFAGIKVDPVRLKDLSEEMELKLSGLEGSIYRSAGEEFNINSPKQLSVILFERLGLRPVKKTKTGYSTDEEVLNRLAVEHEIPEMILAFRQLGKLKSTYVDALLGLINPETGRVHTSFNQTVTATGRLSSSRPNLQNIPVRGEMASRIRGAFVAEEGFKLFSADYSQIELRLVAHMSSDPVLTDAFRNDEDIHTRTASEIFSVPLEEVTPELRRRAKAINFGIIYGMGPYGLSTELDISMGEASEYIESYFEHYSLVKEFMDGTIREAAEKGFTKTLFGRRRFIPELKSNIDSAVRFGERMAINTPVQGSAADLIKAAMIKIHGRLGEGGFRSRMILQIHDELVFEVANGEVEPVIDLVRAEMEGVVDLSVPIKVNLKLGDDWSTVE